MSESFSEVPKDFEEEEKGKCREVEVEAESYYRFSGKRIPSGRWLGTGCFHGEDYQFSYE